MLDVFSAVHAPQRHYCCPFHKPQRRIGYVCTATTNAPTLESPTIIICRRTKVWDVKGALTWRGDEERSVKDPSTSASNNDDDTGNRSVGFTIATATANGDDANSNYGGSSSRDTRTEEADSTDSPSGHRTPTTQQQLQVSSSAPFGDPHREDAASVSSQEEDGPSTAIVGEDSDEDHGSSNIANSSAMKRGDSMLWPSEPSESVKGEDYGDR